MEYLEKSYKIPSNGIFGGPKKITLREMTTREEKILLGTKDFSVFERLVKSCCIDEEIDFDKLHSIDIMYLTFMLRELTYGPEYSQECICPECGAKFNTIVNINEMSVKVLSDEQVQRLQNGITVELSNGDKVTVNMLSCGESRQIDRMIKVKTKQGRLKDPQSYEMVVRLATAISNIETKEPTETDFSVMENKIGYIDSLRMKDLSLVRNALNEFEFGLDRKIYRKCENCEEDVEVIGYIVPEFFHPSK